METIRLILAGRRDLFAELVERYGGLVFAVIHSAALPPDEAEDLAQDVFIKVFRSLSRFRGEASFATWVHRIAQNHVRDKIRGRRPAAVTLDDAVELTIAAPGPSPEEAAAAADERARIRECLAELPVIYREVLYCYHYHGLSYEDIGRRLGLPVKTVETRLYRAKKMLRSKLEVCAVCAK